MPVELRHDPFALVLPDVEFEKPFRAYCNYFQDLAGLISGQHGFAPTLVEGVYRSVEAQPAVGRIPGRPLSAVRQSAVKKALRKSWGALRRVEGLLEDFEEELNASLPGMAYQAVYHAVQALAIASGQDVPRTHRQVLNLASKEIQRGLLPFPWALTCGGCPQTGSAALSVRGADDPVHVLSSPDPATAEARLGMLLRTTREKELERRFAEDRQRKLQPGQTRRNLGRAEKERTASRLTPTTVVDVFYRLRKKAQYEDADVFVLGAAGESDARAFAESVLLVCDGSVAAFDGAIGAYAGANVMAQGARDYLARIRSGQHGPVARRLEAWEARLGRRAGVSAVV